jgi:hypothetical protein
LGLCSIDSGSIPAKIDTTSSSATRFSAGAIDGKQE